MKTKYLLALAPLSCWAVETPVNPADVGLQHLQARELVMHCAETQHFIWETWLEARDVRRKRRTPVYKIPGIDLKPRKQGRTFRYDHVELLLEAFGKGHTPTVKLWRRHYPVSEQALRDAVSRLESKGCYDPKVIAAKRRLGYDVAQFHPFTAQWERESDHWAVHLPAAHLPRAGVFSMTLEMSYDQSEWHIGEIREWGE